MSQQQTTPNTIELAFATDRTQVGGKAFHLQRAISMGMRVPTGFVIPCSALMRFLTENALIAQVDNYLTQREERSGKELREQHEGLCAAIMNAPLPRDIEQDVTFQAEKILA